MAAVAAIRVAPSAVASREAMALQLAAAVRLAKARAAMPRGSTVVRAAMAVLKRARPASDAERNAARVVNLDAVVAVAETGSAGSGRAVAPALGPHLACRRARRAFR